ncbi:MAG TPA: tetratricopeptide repeat protein [Hanamia sp.]|nr:tetratricopeptide repeat protein [Hanamia sp.]
MSKIVLITSFLFITYSGFGQQKEIDSLLRSLHAYNQQDTVRLKMFLEASYDYAYSEPDKGLALADSAIVLAQELHDSTHLSSGYSYRALNYSSAGNDSAAIKDYKHCILIREALKENLELAKAYHNIGIIYFNLSDYPSALSHQQKALHIFQQTTYLPGLGATQNSIGAIYLALAYYVKALQHFFTAREIYEKQHDTLNLSEAYTNIGLIYTHTKNYKKALHYYFSALDITKKAGVLDRILNVLSDIGEAYDYMGNSDSSLEYYRKALTLSKRINNAQITAQALLNMGTTFYNRKWFDSAFVYIRKAIKGCQEEGGLHNLANAYIILSGIYFNASSKALSEISIHPSQRYNVALVANKKALALAQNEESLSDQRDVWEGFSDIYTAQKKYGPALDAYKKYIVFRDSTMSGEKKSEITRIAMQYDFDKKQALENAEDEKRAALAAANLDKEKLTRRRDTMATIIFLTLAGVVVVFYTRKRNAEFKTKVADTELKALRSQMNPHFIFNSLNSINNFIARNEPGQATEYLGKFAKVMRLILENSEKKSIPLADELKSLELYMQLESKRLNGKFAYEIKVADNINKENTLVPPMILQPFVENSIWHGIAKKEGKGNIMIDIRSNGQMLNCLIDDDGIGFQKNEPSASQEKQSLGMKITKARIDIINKTKKSKGTVELSDLSKGVRVQLNLPLELSF